MAMSRQEKEEVVSSLADKFRRAKTLVFAKFAQVPVKDLEILRRKARGEGVQISIAKKTLFKRAVDATELKDVDPTTLPESVMALFGFEDEIAPAKLIAEFAKTHEAVKILGGAFEGRAASQDEMVRLSKVPSRIELLKKLVGTMNAPASGFVQALSGNIRGLVVALQAIQKQKAA